MRFKPPGSQPPSRHSRGAAPYSNREGREPVKTPRRYDSSRRQQAAQRSRWAILEAARALFSARGYSPVTIRAIADSAGVSPKTVEAMFGTKANLLKILVDVSIAGDDAPGPLGERPVIQQMSDEPDVRRVLALFAALVAGISRRLAPVAKVIEQAAPTDRAIAELAETGRRNRLAGARAAAGMLASKARLRVEIDQAVDTLWMLNDPALYESLVGQRGWTHAAFEKWLADTTERLLLRGSGDSS